MAKCPDIATLIESEIDRVLTQYRESPNLLHIMRNFMGQVGDVLSATCHIPDAFDIDNAVGEQLTFLGGRLGFPRCHCVCTVQPVFGFACEGYSSQFPLVGFCEEGSTWVNCGVFGDSEICLNDDAIYRTFLKVRRYQMLGLFDLESLEETAKIFWGPTARVLDAGHLRVVLAPGRPLSSQEEALLQLYNRVLPLAPGVTLRFHFGETRVFGFGEGWGGFAEEDLDTTRLTEAYIKTGKVFGFCEVEDDEIGGFCEEWEPNGLPLVMIDSAGNEVPIVTEDGEEIVTGPLTSSSSWVCRRDAPWMCEVDVRPYSC